VKNDLDSKLSFLNTLGIIFLLSGIIWISLVAFTEGTILLIEPAIVNIITGIFLFFKYGRGYLRYLSIAAGFYNLVLFGFLAYSSGFFLQFGLTLLFIVSIIGYGIGFLVFSMVVFFSYTKQKAFVRLKGKPRDR
jgi:hypothetical protein